MKLAGRTRGGINWTRYVLAEGVFRVSLLFAILLPSGRYFGGVDCVPPPGTPTGQGWVCPKNSVEHRLGWRIMIPGAGAVDGIALTLRARSKSN